MKTKKGFLDGYKTYDTSDGYGNKFEWQQAFKQMTGEEAQEVIKEQKLTPWQILGISRTASAEEIKKAFRKKINEWHPDKNPQRIKEAEEMSKKIIAAYTILTK